MRAAGVELAGELILIGNGIFYGGSYGIFPGADLRNGLLEVCALPRVNLATLLRCAPKFALRRQLPDSVVRRCATAAFELTSDGPASFELDGEWAGHLPAKFFIEPARLRVVVP